MPVDKETLEELKTNLGIILNTLHNAGANDKLHQDLVNDNEELTQKEVDTFTAIESIAFYDLLAKLKTHLQESCTRMDLREYADAAITNLDTLIKSKPVDLDQQAAEERFAAAKKIEAEEQQRMVDRIDGLFEEDIQRLINGESENAKLSIIAIGRTIENALKGIEQNLEPGQSFYLATIALKNLLCENLRKKLHKAEQKGQEFDIRNEDAFTTLRHLYVLLPTLTSNTLHYNVKISALKDFENCAKNSKLWKTFGKVIGIFLFTAVGFVLGAVAGAAIGAGVTALSGPGVVVGAALGAITGANKGAIIGATLGASIFGTASTYCLFKKNPEEKCLTNFSDKAEKFISKPASLNPQ